MSRIIYLHALAHHTCIVDGQDDRTLTL